MELPDVLEERFRKAVARHNLAQHYSILRKFARLSFLLRVEACTRQDEVPVGVSRLGGTPDLPAGWVWPVKEKNKSYAPTEKQLLGFLGQINFADIPKFGQALPSSGILYVFAETEESKDTPHVLLFAKENDQATRRPMPDLNLFVDEYIPRFGILRIKDFVPSVSLPDGLDRYPPIGDEGYESYHQLILDLNQDTQQHEPSSRMLGYPSTPYEELLPDDGWELLVQIESFYALNGCVMSFWDAGCFQVVAPTNKMSHGQFDLSKAGIESA